MSRADFSDPAIQAKVDEIKKGGGVNWVLVGYVPKSDTKLKVADEGTGGVTECTSNLSDGKILFAFIASEVNQTRKFVYISWCGEGVTGMKKGLFSNHSTDVANGPFKGFHVQINARSENDVEEKIINDRLKKATGANYDSGQKNQGNAKLVPTSVAQGKVQATQSNAKVKTADKSDYDKKNESAEFWTTANKVEPAAPAPAKKAAPNVGSGNSSNLKNKFENPQPQAPPAKAAPAPGRLPPQGNAPQPPSKPTSAPPAQPPKQHAPPPPAPVAEPEPEPVQEETYHEEAQPEQTYQEEQSYDDQQQDQSYQEGGDQSYQEGGDYQEGDQSYQEGGDQTYQEEQPYVGEEQHAGDGTSARALYDFVAESETDLSFNEGDIITILDKTDPSGWYKGTLNGAEGYFPSNFVEDI